MSSRTAPCPLDPRGLGSPLTESLSSYLVRLAASQVLPTATFATRFLNGRDGPVKYPEGRTLYGGRGIWMNGMGRWAREMTGKLEGLTGIANLSALTALPWNGVLSPSGLTANVRRWCPACYGEMRRAHGECWDPLLWFYAPVARCFAHGASLAMTCRNCGSVQPWLPHDTTIGWCAICGEDLASAAALPETGHATQRELWTAGVCGELCAAGYTAARGQERVAARRDFSELVRWLVNECDGGNRSAFARRLGVSVHTPSRWIQAGVIRIDSLLLLCMRLGLRPAGLLLGDGPPRFGPVEVDSFPERRRRSNVNWARVDEDFKAIIQGSPHRSLAGSGPQARGAGELASQTPA